MHTARSNLVFSSVFPVPSITHSTPTPIATPDLGSTAPGQSFGGIVSNISVYATPDPAAHPVKRSLAWSTATRFLSLPRPTGSETRQLNANAWGQRQPKGPDVREALQFLLVGNDSPDYDSKQWNLIDWYTNEARAHFVAYVHPTLQSIWNTEFECRNAWKTVEDTALLLQQVQTLYLQPLNEHILPFLSKANQDLATPGRNTNAEPPPPALVKFKRDLRAIFVHSLPPQRFSKTLSYVLYESSCKLFLLHMDQDVGNASPRVEDSLAVRKSLLQLLYALKEVGLGGDQAQRAFAHAMDKLINAFIESHYMKVDWYGRAPVTQQLRQWIKDGFTPLVRQIMEYLNEDEAAPQVNELQQWQEMAIGRLGRARVENLFDYIVNWDRSLGAILDLKEYITTPAARSHLASALSQQLSRRVLHAGATTTHILDIYIYIIRAFTELEPKGVLLERVAGPIRRYLREREDTARIVVSSLLADIKDENGKKIDSGGDISTEIAAEMLKPIASNINEQAEAVSWGDMNWTPDPLDASPEYKKAKNQDIMSYLLTLYDRDDFVTELKNILGEHLLKNENSELEKEIRLLEHFRIRLGEDKLQACEVMLRDIQDSRRIQASIQSKNPKNGTGQPRLNTQILSSYFWPSLREDAFLAPAPVLELQEEYSKQFEAIKDMRKLHWLAALGRATVELQLEDRTINLDVQTWQASVIYAFQAQPGEPLAVAGVLRTAEQLSEMLEMDEELVSNALTFWVGQLVLREIKPGTYAVIERLSSSAADAEAAAAAREREQQSEAKAVKSTEDLLAEKMQLYRQFVLGMLTNQGSMNAMRIMMMLKMAVPGGFPFGLEEVRSLLGRMVGEGVLVVTGDVYGVKK